MAGADVPGVGCPGNDLVRPLGTEFVQHRAILRGVHDTGPIREQERTIAAYALPDRLGVSPSVGHPVEIVLMKKDDHTLGAPVRLSRDCGGGASQLTERRSVHSKLVELAVSNERDPLPVRRECGMDTQLRVRKQPVHGIVCAPDIDALQRRQGEA